MKKGVMLLALMVGYGICAAADPSEKGVPTSPLTIYSGGVGVGAALAVNDELDALSERFMKLSFVNTVYFRDNVDLFLDVNWLLRGTNVGVDAGFDYLFGGSDFRPFMGFGVGAHHFDREGASFGENFGPSATAHVGFLIEISDALLIRMRVPFHAVLNETLDQTVGFDLSFLFSDRFRKVKKLEYN